MCSFSLFGKSSIYGITSVTFMQVYIDRPLLPDTDTLMQTLSLCSINDFYFLLEWLTAGRWSSLLVYMHKFVVS